MKPAMKANVKSTVKFHDNTTKKKPTKIKEQQIQPVKQGSRPTNKGISKLKTTTAKNAPATKRQPTKTIAPPKKSSPSKVFQN